MFEKDELQIGYNTHDDVGVFRVHHFKLAEKHRGYGRASAALQTLIRVAYHEGMGVIEVTMGGGEDAEEFLERNGFHVYYRCEYTHDAHREGEYWMDAVQKIT